MKIIFISNYYTHHQAPLCRALYELTDGQFLFLETEAFSRERQSMGWQAQTGVPFVRGCGQWSREDAAEALLSADVVILGSAPLSLVTRRLQARKLVFLYAERIYKDRYQPLKWLPRLYRFRQRYGKYRSLHLLAASAFAYGDYAMHGAFWGRAYQWGYFPQTRTHDISRLAGEKETNRLLWCGRFLDWKHPEAALITARRLRENGIPFALDLIGTGPEGERLRQLTQTWGLTDCVRFLGTMSAGEVRAHMEASGIFVFTSDQHEGWGAVVNEAMNSGCAVVASHAAGSVPFLIRHGENGLICRSGDTDGLYACVRDLLERPERQRALGTAAYQTIVRSWNAENAARRLIAAAERIREHGSCDLYEDGPCSRAPLVRNDWFRG